MPRQLSFDLPARAALGRDDFFVSPANAQAVALIGAPGGWPSGKLVLYGPTGAGKSHLVHVWADATGARIVAARDLATADIAALAVGPVAVEDVPEIAGEHPAEAALFHLHNLVLAEGHGLLMTGRDAPGRWGMRLPDLQSRIDGTQSAPLSAPDDALLAAVLAKLFNDRQIAPHANVIPYLVAHMERSFDAAARIVSRLDALALEERSNLNRKLAARLLKGESLARQ